MNKKLFVFLMAVLTVIIGLAFVPAMNAQDRGLDLDRHCRNHGRERAVNIDGTAYGWKCQDSNGVNWDMSMDNACSEQHGSGASAHFRDMNDTYSWYCRLPASGGSGSSNSGGGNNQPPPPQPTSPPPPPGVRTAGLDLNAYCARKGLGVAELIGNRWAGDWRCRDGNGNLHPMNIAEACQMLNGLPYVGLGNPEDASGWYCADQPVPLATPRETEGGGSNPPPPPNDVPDPGAAFGNQDRGRSSGQCEIREFSLNPAGPYVLGQEVAVRLRTSCSTVRFSVNGDVRDELGAPDHSYTFRTASRGVGSFEICGEGRTSSSWDNAARQCVQVYVGPQWRVAEYTPPRPPAQEPSSTNRCSSLSRLSVGDIAVAAFQVNVRHQPTRDSERKFQLAVGNQVSIISGPRCDGNYVWWEVGIVGNSGWAAELDNESDRLLVRNGEPLPGGGSTTGGSGTGGNVITLPTSVPQSNLTSVPPPPARNLITQPVTLADGTVFGFEVDRGRYRILNGSEYVVFELQKLENRLRASSWDLGILIEYLTPRVGRSDRNISQIKSALCGNNETCRNRLEYEVGDRLMDLSGVGNLAYGYFVDTMNLPLALADITANLDQLPSSIFAREFITFSDNPDDRMQRSVGAELRRRGLSDEALSNLSNEWGLF